MNRLMTTLVASLLLTSLASGEAASGLPQQGVTQNRDAREAYLKGKSEKSKNTAESVRNAIRHFEEAIEKDPRYAPAYLMLADSYYSLGQVFLSLLSSESSEPTPEETTPQQATPSSSEIAVRVSAWVDPESRELLPSDAEVWFQGHGSLWLSRDPVKILGKRPPGQTENLHIYPDGRDGKQIVVPITMTADMCPQGCDRDTILINITDDSVEVVGNAIKNRSVTFSRR